MKRFLFSSGHFPGYVDWGGLLDTACVLQNKGHEVLWVSGSSISSLLRRVKVPFTTVPVAFGCSDSSGNRSAIGAGNGSKRARAIAQMIDLWMDEVLVAASCDAHLRLIAQWSPDVVIADPTVLGAALAAEAAAIPLAECGYPGATFVIPGEPGMMNVVDEFHARLNRLRARVGLRRAPLSADPDFLYIAPALHLVYTTPEWFDRILLALEPLATEGEGTLLSQKPRPSPGAHYVGGMPMPPRTAAPEWIDNLPRDRPLVLIGRSTNYQPMAESMRIAFEIIKGAGAYGLVGGSPALRSALEPLPPHIRWEPWLAYEHVMPRMNAIIHHGGFGTTSLAVRHAVPQVVVPEISDNYTHAQSVANTGAALAFGSSTATAGSLTAALRDVLEKPEYRASAINLQKKFSSLGGAPRAAELLLALANGKSVTATPPQ
jgi:zeaxanthin glucosyltransferase